MSIHKPNNNIRLANDNDFEAIYQIWVDGVSNSFDTTLVDMNEMKGKLLQNFKLRSGIFNYWVCVNELNIILGWQSLNKTTTNPMKENLFAESSTYVKTEGRKFGIGKILLEFAIKEAEQSPLQYITAYISDDNEAIRKATATTGWKEIGILPKSPSSNNKFRKLFIVRPV